MSETPVASPRVLVASNNAHKLTEIREILTQAGASTVQLLTPRDLGLDLDPAETGLTYVSNALIKARAFVRAVQHSGQDEALDWVLSDDSGLEVDALGGRPGLVSARYFKAAVDAGSDGCIALLTELIGVPSVKRAARFRAVIVLAKPGGAEHVFDGVCEGRIGREKRGLHGFGFDPVFMVDTRAMAELPSSEKHILSHRGIAVRKALGVMLAGDRM
jgi:XTP/dITP diphosphohydrolase